MQNISSSFFSSFFLSFYFELPFHPFSEAEYAFQQRKKIIPLIMQKGYKPDGWLGMILGAKLFYDFSGKYSFESRISQLLKAVHEAAGTGNGDATDGEAKKQKATFHVAPEEAAVVWQQVVCLLA